MDATTDNLAGRARDALRRGDAGAARELLESWMQRDAGSPEPRFLLGLALEQSGDLQGADRSLQAALRLAPGEPALWFHRARVLARADRAKEAESALRESIRLKPDVAEAHHNLALLLLRRGGIEDALASLERAVALRPGYAEAHCAMGDALRRAGRGEDSEAAYRRALAADPGHGAARNNLATLLAARERYAEAAVQAAEFAARHPDHPHAWLNLSELRLQCRDPRAALEAVERARRLDAGDVAILTQHMRTLAILERFDEARALLDEGMRSAPRDMERALLPGSGAASHDDYVMPPVDPRGAFVEYHFDWLRREDWQDYDALRGKMLGHIREALDEGVAIVSPNTTAYLCCDEPELEHRLAVTYAEHFASRVPRGYRHEPGAARGDRIRVGFASPMFGHFAVDHVSRDLYRLLSRDRFEVFGYSLNRREDEWHERIAALFDGFRDLSGVNNETAAARIHDDRLDILVDLYGYGPEQRPEIFARRPAPVQLCQVGLANTSGAPWIDYRVASPAAMPDWLAAHFSEHVVRVPVIHHVLTGFPEAAERPGRADAGLPDEAFVYCCFQRSEKLTPRDLDVWSSVLAEAGDSVLWLLASGERGRANLRAALGERGVEADRVVFAGREKLEGHVARQHLADAFLNPFMYSGFNTAAIALWCGVPVVAREGASFATRGANAALSAAGLEDLVASGDDAYRDLAIRLARDAAFRESVRGRLSRERLRGNLFAGERNLRHFERALEMMVRRHREGLPPAPFDVDDA